MIVFIGLLTTLATFLLPLEGDIHLGRKCAGMKQSPGSGPIRPSYFGTLRIFAVIYIAQAGIGTVAGVAYAVWLLYW